MVQSVEAIVVREGDVCGVVQQQSQHVIPFLRDRVVKGSVAFGVLETRKQVFLVTCCSSFRVGVDFGGWASCFWCCIE